MKIEVHAICYNEEMILPYFIRHYSQFADIYLHDNYSTDGTDEIASKAGVNVIKYDSGGEIRDDIYLQIKNNCWKSSQADWIIVCDADEFVYHPDLVGVLEKTDSTVFCLKVLNMYSQTFPTTEGQIYEEVNMGVPYDINPTKMLLFKRSDIKEINYGPGCHHANPVGNVRIDWNSDIKFLHMRFLSKEYVLNRAAKHVKRLSAINKRMGWGTEISWSAEKIINEFDTHFKQITKVV